MQPIERDLVVSLGTKCEVAYNLRRFYGMERAGLFDWLITPLSCLPNLIRNRFALVDDDFREALVRVELPAKDSIMHAPTGVLLHHAFTRDKRDRISWKWRFEVRKVAEKFEFLGSRMDAWLSEARSPALFIKGTGWHEALSRDVIAPMENPDIYERIIVALRDTYPNLDPLFCLSEGYDGALDRVSRRTDVRLVTIGNHGDWHEGVEGHFAGRQTAWREGLSSLGIQLVDREALRLSSPLR